MLNDWLRKLLSALARGGRRQRQRSRGILFELSLHASCEQPGVRNASPHPTHLQVEVPGVCPEVCSGWYGTKYELDSVDTQCLLLCNPH